MTTIVITKPKTLTESDKIKLSSHGLIIIEAEKESDVIFKDLSIDFVYTNCYTCGDRIYVTKERMDALTTNKKTFYCSHGHPQNFK